MARQRRLSVCQGFQWNTVLILNEVLIENQFEADQDISYAPIVYHSGAFYIVGGFINGGTKSKIIGRLDASTLTWTKAGELNLARDGHGAIFNGEKLIVAGGRLNIKNEACKIDNGLVTCIEQAPNLYHYWVYPEMYLVADSYCKNI